MKAKSVAEEREVAVPEDLSKALAEAPEAEAAWNELTAIGRRDFVRWINEAKLEKTRRSRLERAVENLVKGKRRPCCYAVVPMDFYRALGDAPESKAGWTSLTADEKRDYSDWIEESPDKETRKGRVVEAIGMITAGKRLGS